MPGSDLKTFKMTEKDADLVGPFFDSEDDEVPVDMEMVFEAMKHVPLPDLDYPEQDDPSSGEPSPAEPVSARANRADPDIHVPKAILKRKGGVGEMGQPKKKVGGAGRVSKRLKVEVQNSEVLYQTSPKQSSKVERAVGVATDAAAKVAAEVAPNVVTGGVVAETRPRPDFSLWTVGDDLLLKNAMEAGAAMEALAKGAMRFSYRFSVRELRERWRALLYDPEISEQAAVRMVEAEYGSSYSGPKSPTEQKDPQELARKRRANSIRTLYYKRSKKTALDDIVLGSPKGHTGDDDAAAPRNGLSGDMGTDPGVKPVINVVATCSVDTICVSPKDTTSVDFDDRTFSQMFSLLAAGGVQAVIGDIPGGASVDVPDQEVVSTLVDALNRVSEHPVEGGLFELGVTGEEASLLRTENGHVTSSDSIFEVSREVGGSSMHIAESMEMHASSFGLRHDCRNVEDGSTCTDVVIEVDTDLQPAKDCSKILKLEVENDVVSSREENGDPFSCTGGPALVVPPHDVLQTVNGGFEDRSTLSLPPISSCNVDRTGISDMSSLDNQAPEMGCFTVNLPEVKDECPCATSLVSTVDHRHGLSADVKASCSSAHVRVDISNLEAQNSTQILDRGPWLTMDNKMDLEMEDSDRVENVYRECRCVENCTGDASDEREDDCVCDEIVIDGKCFLREHDSYLPSVLTGESCTLDLDCEYEQDGCDVRLGNFAPSVLEPFICTLNTQDTEIPSLDDALLSSPSPPSSPSDQGEYLGCTDSPFAGADADGYTDNYADVDGDGDEDADDDCIECSSRQIVGSLEIEPTSMGRFCEALTDPAELFPSVDRIGGKMAVEDEKVGFEGSLPINLRVSTLAASGPDQRVSSLLPDIGNSHQLSVSQASGHAILQPPNNFRVLDMRISSPAAATSSGPNFLSGQVDREANADAGMGNIEPEMSPSRDLANTVPEKALTSGEACKLRQELLEEELESDEEMARFSDIEAMILDMDLDVADDDFSARAESRRMYRQHGRAFVRSEQAATAAMQRALNLRGAFATLYGRHLRYYIKQTEVLMGRATSDNAVDIDLGKEGRANKVSRQQAYIKLKDDGVFYLRNLGRRDLTVNNKSVETGQRAILGSNCLIEVGGMHFIFETNRKLVKDHIERRQQPQ